MKPNRIRTLVILAMFMASVVFVLSQCGGGGGGGSTPAPAAAKGSGAGKVAASVVLSGRIAGRTVGQTTGQVALTITISGIYSEDDTEFDPIVVEDIIDLTAGEATVSVINVPIGVNHLLVIQADWGNGNVETVKAIIPHVNEDEVETVLADQASTVLANTAIYYAEQQGLELPDITIEQLNAWSMNIGLLLTSGTAFADMDPASVINYTAPVVVPAGVVINPNSATVVSGATTQFMIAVIDTNGMEISGATATLAIDNATLGTIDAAGLFTAAQAGTGILTATYDTFSATASITVTSSTPAPTCGDSTIDSGETCDDGASNTSTPCTAAYGMTCTYCDTTCTSQTVTGATCGDSNVDSLDGETCDDGNNLNADGCSSTCTIEAYCGDGNVDSGNGETCDSGASNTSTPCTAAYGATCSYCDLTCTSQSVTGSFCGDTVLDSIDGEVCDDGGESISCNIDCTMSSCGDGVINATAGETCDDGVSNGTNGFCNNTCDGTVTCVATAGACTTNTECCNGICFMTGTMSTWTTTTLTPTSSMIMTNTFSTYVPGPYTCN